VATILTIFQKSNDQI